MANTGKVGTNNRVGIKRKRNKVVPIRQLTVPVYLPQPDEPPKAASFYLLYRDLGTERSVVEVSRQAGHEYKHMQDLATRWRWKERSEAWDKHLEEIKVKEFEDAGRSMARRQARLGMLLQEKAEDTIGLLVYDGDECKPTAKDVATLADVGVKIERLARGEKVEDDKVINIILPNIPEWAKSSPSLRAANVDSDGEKGKSNAK